MKTTFFGHQLNREKVLRLLLIAVAAVVSVKYIFVDFGVDAEFQISMAYRMVAGDAMFTEMWEPYQMSAFLCALFIKIYLTLFKTTTGIVLYLQTVGVLIDAGISVLLYKIVKKYLNAEKTGFLMAWLFVMISPKDNPLADYTNMQMWFALLLCIFMFLYYETKKRRYVIATALSMCGVVLSYPSCMLLLLGVLFMFFYKKDYKNALLVIGICALAGGIYLCFIFVNVTPGEFFEIVRNILQIETSHSAGLVERIWLYFKDFIEIIIVLAILYGISFGVTRFIPAKNEDEIRARGVIADLLFVLMTVFIGLYTVICWREYVRYCYSIVFLAVIFVGWRMLLRTKMSEEKRYFYLCGTIISILQFLATLMLTNLAMIASVPFLLIAVLAALLPIEEGLKGLDIKKSFLAVKRVAVTFILFALVFRSVYMIRPMTGYASSICEIASIVKEGPAIGIISEYMGPYIQNETIKEWKQYIKDGQSIYIVGGELDTLGYLYADTEIAAPSVVPTPGYNEGILKYWEMNPEKYPDVIIASCWYGELCPELKEGTWIHQWINEEYQPAYYIDGKYWRYYFRE